MGTTAEQQDAAPWRRALAYCWYAWGLSWCHWGIRTADQGCFRAGVRAFDRAARIWPQFAGCFYRRGIIRSRELGEYGAGMADLGRAIALAPEWADPYLQRGLLQRFHGDPRAAIADLQQYVALTDDPSWRAEAQQQIDAIRSDLPGGQAEDQAAGA